MADRRRKYEKLVADDLWIRDGQPDGTQPGEANRNTYDEMTRLVFDSLDRLNLRVTRSPR